MEYPAFNPNNAPGIGEAYLLKGNQAVDIFNNNIAQQEQQRRAQEYQRQRQLAAEQQDITDGLAKLSPGDYWINHDEEINKDYKDLVGYGTKLKYEGRNPFSDPDFLTKKTQLEAKAKFSKQLQDDYKLVQAELLKNPDGYDNQDEVLGSYIGKKSISDYMKEGYKRPQLNKRYSLSDVIKDNKIEVGYEKNNDGTYDTTRINRSGIIDQALNTIDSEASKYILTKSGADTNVYKTGFPMFNKDGKRVWSTNPENVTKIATNVLENDPEFPQYLQQKGYDVSDPYKALLATEDFVKRQNNAVGSYAAKIADTVSGKGTTDRTRVYTAEANSRANSAESRANQKFNLLKGKLSKEENAYEVRKRFIASLQNKNQDAVEDLKAALSVDNGTALFKEKDGKTYLVVNTKSKNTLDGQYRDDPPVEIDLTSPSSYTAIDMLLERTGFTKLEKKVTPDEAGTGQRYSTETLDLFTED